MPTIRMDTQIWSPILPASSTEYPLLLRCEGSGEIRREDFPGTCAHRPQVRSAQLHCTSPKYELQGSDFTRSCLSFPQEDYHYPGLNLASTVYDVPSRKQSRQILVGDACQLPCKARNLASRNLPSNIEAKDRSHGRLLSYEFSLRFSPRNFDRSLLKFSRIVICSGVSELFFKSAPVDPGLGLRLFHH